jgi:hypothetical protein
MPNALLQLNESKYVVFNQQNLNEIIAIDKS